MENLINFSLDIRNQNKDIGKSIKYSLIVRLSNYKKVFHKDMKLPSQLVLEAYIEDEQFLHRFMQTAWP